MKCQECGKSHKVTINNRSYCANCGAALSGGKPLSKAVKNKAVLDLTHFENKISKPVTSSEHKKRPAQSIHGIRRNAAHNAQLPVPHVKNRHAKAVATTHRSSRIAKFHRPSLRSDNAEATSETPMSPHRTYPLQTVPKQKQVAAGMAKHHPRSAAHIMNNYQPKTASPKRRFRRLRKNLAVFNTRPRWATTMAVVASALVLAGYVTYLNLPNISLRVAANRAGLDAQTPGYTPPGYSFKGPTAYGPGQITLAFNSNSDEGYINVTQRRTPWDSATMLEEYVKPKTGDLFSTSIQNGLTIYVYKSNQAAWVSNGILYTIEGNSNLNPEQVLKIASSL